MGDSDTLPTGTDISVAHDDASVIFSQSPDWYEYNGQQGSVYMVTKTYLAQFTYTFVGSKIWYYSDMDHDHGPFSASIDGVMYGTWTSAWPTRRPGVVLFHASVQPGQHTLTVTNLSTNFTSLEHLAYRPLTSDSAMRNTSSGSRFGGRGTVYSMYNNNRPSLLGPSYTPNLAPSGTEPQDSGVPSPSPPSQRSNTVAYIGIALGAVCFLLLAAVIALLYILHRRRSSTAYKGVLLQPSIDIEPEHDITASHGLHPFPVPPSILASSSSDTSYAQSRKLEILALGAHKEGIATVSLE